MKKNGEGKKSRKGSGWLVALAVMITAGLGGFALLQIRQYEKSVLEIYADSQDAYVQLVLDQINLIENRTDEEIVNDILGTLDASSNRYWTLSNQNALVFVKDVLETNRYRGFTTSTYYVSPEARSFIEQLTVNRVVHEQIPMEEQTYIASGVAFRYNGTDYQICLLTNPDTVLDQNIYLNARINLSILVAAVLFLFLGTLIAMTLLFDRRGERLEQIGHQNAELRATIEKLSAELERKRLFDTQLSVFHSDVLPMMLKKLERKKISPVVVATLSYDSEEARQQFLLAGQILLDEHVFRFHQEETHTLTLVAVFCSRTAALRAIRAAMNPGVHLERMVTTESMSEQRQ